MYILHFYFGSICRITLAVLHTLNLDVVLPPAEPLPHRLLGRPELPDRVRVLHVERLEALGVEHDGEDVAPRLRVPDVRQADRGELRPERARTPLRLVEV